MKAPQYNSSLRKRFLAFAAALVLFSLLCLNFIQEALRSSISPPVPGFPECSDTMTRRSISLARFIEK